MNIVRMPAGPYLAARHAGATSYQKYRDGDWALGRLLLTLLSGTKLVFATLDSALQAYVSVSLG